MRRENSFDEGEDGGGGRWEEGLCCCIWLRTLSRRGEPDALAGEGGCLLPPAEMPPALCLSQHLGLKQDGIWPQQQPAACLLSWCSWTIRVNFDVFSPACTTTFFVGSTHRTSVRMLG